jgi:hypothetical protein
MRFATDRERKLKQVIRIQKEMVDSANRIILLQQGQINDLITKMDHYLGLDEELVIDNAAGAVL